MMMDIFSSFDPKTSSFLIPLTFIFLATNLFILTQLNLSMFPSISRQFSSKTIPMEVIFSQLMRTNSSNLKGLSMMVSSIFITIILVNLMGMIPYTFSLSSHLILTLSLGLPLWMSLIISSFSYNPKSSVAHFLPDGAPDWLNPFLVLIETTSILVRPITLSFRLAANMTAGHIVLTLVSVYMSSSFFSSYMSMMSFSLFNAFYIAFELAICLIQAYIFCLLISLYSEDHA